MASLEEDESSTQPPQHPVPQLQGPFEESMMESLTEIEEEVQNADSVARRKLLLQGDRYQRVCAGRWKQRPGEKFHPLWKLSAQLSFGLHLLAQGLAKSEEEVMRILQSHVDDIDGFLERTTEDFDLAQSDVEERLRYLRLPLEHVQVFDHMLDDRAFRTSIVEGNEKIEHIVERTSEAMKDALKDISKGIDATSALGKYLTDLKNTWTDRTPELEAVYVAMLGNVEGWTRAFMDLHQRGNRLAVSLVQLAGIVAEMQRRAGIASRKVLLSFNNAHSITATSTTQRGHTSPSQLCLSSEPIPPRSPLPLNNNPIPNKPLPMAPDLMIPARQASRAKLAHEEKLRRRSLDVLREQEERTRAAQTPPGRKSSMAEKVLSVTKKASAPALTSKVRSPKPSDTKSSISSKPTATAAKSSKVAGRDSAARMLASSQAREAGAERPSNTQLSGPVELPAEMPVDTPAAQDTSKKGGLHLHLGSKHRNRENSGGLSTSKSLNIFRRSPQFPKPPEAAIEFQPAEPITGTTKSTETSPRTEEWRPMGSHISSPPMPSAQRSSPDPGLPSPPALVPQNFAQGNEPSPYTTALPDILATAQRAKSVKASLRVSVPSSSEPEPQRTPRPIPSEPSKPVHAAVTLAVMPPDIVKTHGTAENETKQATYQSSLGEPGPGVQTLQNALMMERQSTSALDDEKTPTTAARPQVDLPTASSVAVQETRPESVDTPLTSATIRSYSDFYKLPPQQTSPTPPPITPEGSLLNQSISFSVTSSVAHSRSTSVRETEPEKPTLTGTEPSNEQLDKQPSSAAPPDPKPVPAKKKPADLKDLRLLPRNKDRQNQPEIFDLITSTPPHSPIHTRASSDNSALSTVGMTAASTSRILAPPEEAPPPPAPGGRSMIIPDYASAGAFEGERKSKRSSGMSTSGWKKMFAAGGGGGGGGSTASTTHLSHNSTGIPAGSKEEDEEIHMSANLMSGEGNDVLWYKGMGRDGLWVSGS